MAENPQTPPTNKNRLLRPWWPWLLLLLGACVPMARVLLDPLGSVPGSPLSDVYKHTWAYWHAMAQIGDGAWPYTRYLNAPDGGVLLDVMLPPALIMAPVTLIAGPVLAANLWVLLSLTMVGAVVYALARHFTGSVIGSLCAGLMIQTSPFLLGHALTSGVHERLNLWLYPLIVLALLKVRGGGRWGWSAALIVGLAMTVIQCPTYTVFAAVLMLFMVPFAYSRTAPNRWPRVWPITFTYLGLGVALVTGAVVYNLCVIHPLWLAGIPYERVAPSIGVTADFFYVARLETLFNPFTVMVEKPERTDDELYLLVYIGWVPFIAMLSGMVLALRRRARMSALVCALGFIFLVLSLGPNIPIGGRRALVNPLFHAIAFLVPFYGGAPPIWQQAGVFIALSVVGCAELIRVMPSRAIRVAVAALLLAGTIAERIKTLPVPLVLERAPARVAKMFDNIPGEDPLIEVPRLWPKQFLARGSIFMAQVRHEKPIPVAINLGLPLMDHYQPLTQGKATDWKGVAACLRKRGMRWLVMHTHLMPAGKQTARGMKQLRQLLGEPAASEKGSHLFDLSLMKEGTAVDRACPEAGSMGELK